MGHTYVNRHLFLFEIQIKWMSSILLGNTPHVSRPGLGYLEPWLIESENAGCLGEAIGTPGQEANVGKGQSVTQICLPDGQALGQKLTVLLGAATRCQAGVQHSEQPCGDSSLAHPQGYCQEWPTCHLACSSISAHPHQSHSQVFAYTAPPTRKLPVLPKCWHP